MPQQFLDGTDVVPGLQEVGGEGVAKGVGGDGFGDAGSACGFPDGPLKGSRVQVVAPDDARTGVRRETRGREDPLPAPFSFSIGVLAGQGIGEIDGAIALGQVLLVEALDPFQVFWEGFDKGFRQDCDPVFLTLAVPDGDGAVFKVQVFHPQAEAFHEAEAAAVEELGDQEMGTGEVGEEGLDFWTGEDGREALGFTGAQGLDRLGDFPSEDRAIEEEDGLEGLILGSGSDVFVDSQVGEEGFDFLSAHFLGVAFAVEEDETADPIHIGLLGAVRIMLAAQHLAYPVQEFRRGGRAGRFGRI
jgi:hypothetical protein